MREQLPAVEVFEQPLLIVREHRDIDVAVFAGRAAQPGINGPSAAETPLRGQACHLRRDSCEGLGSQRVGVPQVH